MSNIGMGYFLGHIFKFSLGQASLQKVLLSLRDRARVVDCWDFEKYPNFGPPFDESPPTIADQSDSFLSGPYAQQKIDTLKPSLPMLRGHSFFQDMILIFTLNASLDIKISQPYKINWSKVGSLKKKRFSEKILKGNESARFTCCPPFVLYRSLKHSLLPYFKSVKLGEMLPHVSCHLDPKTKTNLASIANSNTYNSEIFFILFRVDRGPFYPTVALRSMHALWANRSKINLLGNHVDVLTGRWTAQDAGIGAGVDSFFEYLVKGAFLLRRPEMLSIFYEAREAIEKHLRHDDWYLWATMNKGHITMAVFQSLEAYWPGVLALIGETENALKIIHNYHQVWKQFGFTPEFYNIPQAETTNNREGYPLRPELAESLMYLYQATGDTSLLAMAADILNSIQYAAKTSCGYATVKNVNDHILDNRMESFFLAETTKYLYLLFDTDHWLHNDGFTGVPWTVGKQQCVIEAGGYIFNTEAHPMDPGAIACCESRNKDPLLSLEDQMSLILNPLAPLKGIHKHQGNPTKEKQSPQQSGKDDGTCSATNDANNPSNKDSSIGDTVVQDYVQDKKIIELEGSGYFQSDVPSRETMEELAHHLDSLTAQDKITTQKSFNNDENNIDDEEEFPDNDNKSENILPLSVALNKEVNEIGAGIGDSENLVKKVDGIPSFSGLEQSEDNRSSLDAASVGTSVSSSKYQEIGSTITQPRIIEPKPIKHKFVLHTLKERLNFDLQTYYNASPTTSFSLLSCPHPPFTEMLNVKGQMFNP
ncbi:unnamed protein product, partial [Meganyctiphanes norvegica]